MQKCYHQSPDKIMHWISQAVVALVALVWAVGTHAAPAQQPSLLLERLGNRVFQSSLKEEDREFVTDPSANTDGIFFPALYFLKCIDYSFNIVSIDGSV